MGRREQLFSLAEPVLPHVYCIMAERVAAGAGDAARKRFVFLNLPVFLFFASRNIT